jgi:hypothetical protein
LSYKERSSKALQSINYKESSMRATSGLLKNLEESRNLPIGHYNRTNSEKAVKQEYSACQKIAKIWKKRFSRRINLSIEDAIQLCNRLCDMFGEQPIRKIIMESADVHAMACAHYYKNEIHFKDKWLCFTTLIHELAHHIGGGGHGTWFCEVLDMLFRACYPIVTGKKTKPDW